MTASHLDEWMRFIEEWGVVVMVGAGAVGVVVVVGAGDY